MPLLPFFPDNSQQQLTYRELNSQANQLAHYLQQLGVGPDVLVAICMERSLEIAIAVLGVLKAGAAYVPLDPAYPKERLTFMLADTHSSSYTHAISLSLWLARPSSPRRLLGRKLARNRQLAARKTQLAAFLPTI